jgi:hypothetical protein
METSRPPDTCARPHAPLLPPPCPSLLVGVFLDVAAQVEFESKVLQRFIIFQLEATKPGAVNPGSPRGHPAPPFLGGRDLAPQDVHVDRGVVAQVEIESKLGKRFMIRQVQAL